YMQMFRNIQRQVQACLPFTGHQTLLGHPYLPIGSAALTPLPAGAVAVGTPAAAVVADSGSRYLISVPTMLLPQPIDQTDNVYWAFRALLAIVKHHNDHLTADGGADVEIDTLIIPGMGTGYGKMTATAAAQHIRWAILDDEHTSEHSGTFSRIPSTQQLLYI